MFILFGGKQIVVQTLLSFMLFASLFPCVNVYADTGFKTIKLAMRTHSPYNIAKSSEHVYKRVICSLKKMNYNVEIMEYPWLRAQASVKENIVQGFFPGSSNAKRELSFVKSQAINEGYICWVSLKNHDFSEGLLNHIKVGAVRGTNAFRWAKKQAIEIHEVNDQRALFTMLNLGRLHKVLASKESLNDYNTDQQNSRYTIAQAYKRTQYVFFSQAFIQRNPEFLIIFNANVKDCILRNPA
ncbi:type 2 periplasmic-binding domain-containing protein [Cognaticolwellia mytili]|uniref:transporter substrate-binding domain-containing protein n=1 Tax=Cognaticolwellia mytili TaxID=1888913 RepID=UPI001301E920|nr:transporter substrate-binding domain-containing protein [Cognaticolwellia mytili]